ncbi:MAG: hypothetical protein WD335_01590 [Candidatus Paceibacterota bacterium]
MSNLDKCPNCGCDLEEEQKKIEKKIDQIIEEEHGEALKGPRKRSKSITFFSGLLVGLVLGALIAGLLVVTLLKLGVNNGAILGFIGISVNALIAYNCGIYISSSAIPKEERYLRKKLRTEIENKL